MLSLKNTNKLSLFLSLLALLPAASCMEAIVSPFDLTIHPENIMLVTATGTSVGTETGTATGTGTDTTAPSAIDSLLATVLGTNNIQLEWKVPTDDVGVTAFQILKTGITLTVASDCDDLDITGAASFATTASAEASITYPDVDIGETLNLNAYTDYHFCVRSQDAAGNFSSWAMVTDKTWPRYVVAGKFNDSCAVKVSGDTLNWDRIDICANHSIASSEFSSIIFANNIFVAVGQGGTATIECLIFTSSNGLDWSRANCPDSLGSLEVTLNDVAFGNGAFVAVGSVDGSTPVIRYSTDDAANWDAPGTGQGTNDYTGVTYHNSSFYASVGVTLGSGGHTVHQSSDPSVDYFTEETSESYGTLYDIAGNSTGTLLAVGQATAGTSAVFTSNDWATGIAIFNGSSVAPRAVVYGDNEWVVVGDNCSVDTSSTPGNAGSWGAAVEGHSFANTGILECSAETIHWSDVTYSAHDNLYVTVGASTSSNYHAFSETGVPNSWTITAFTETLSEGNFKAVAAYD